MKFTRAIIATITFLLAFGMGGAAAHATTAPAEYDPTFVIAVPQPSINENGCAIPPTNEYPEYLDYAFNVQADTAIFTATVKPEHQVAVQVTAFGRAEAGPEVSYTLAVTPGCTVDGIVIGDNADLYPAPPVEPPAAPIETPVTAPTEVTTPSPVTPEAADIPRTELAYTGAKDIFLAVIGVGIVALGVVLIRRSRKTV